jgi:hypothetical protein
MSAEICAAAGARLDLGQARTWSGPWKALGSDNLAAASTGRFAEAFSSTGDSSEAAVGVGLPHAQELEVARLNHTAPRANRSRVPGSPRGGLVSRSGAVGGRTRTGAKFARNETVAGPELALKRHMSELDRRLVVEVEVRARPPWLRCALAPHAAEVWIFRAESRYHRLVFTVHEWDAFVADVKTGLYDVASTP